MTIRAKYSGVCRVCGGKIRVGDEIEWERGEKPAHSKCVKREQKPAPAPAHKVTVEIIDYGTLDEYGQLNFSYRLPSGEARWGRDVTTQGFSFHSDSVEVADAATKLPEALRIKEEFLTQRKEAVESFRKRLLAGEKLLQVESRSFDGYDYPVLGVSKEIADALPFKAYYDLVAELLPWLGDMGTNAYGSGLRTQLPPGTLVSVEDVQGIEQEKYQGWKSRREAHSKHMTEIREVLASGGHIVALKQCWECGRTKIIGEFAENGQIVRMPEAVYRQAVEAQTQGHKRSIEASEGQILSSVGFDPDPTSKFQFRVVESYYCGC